MFETPTPPHHRLSLHTSLGALSLAVDLTLSAPWTVIFGPSGSGKSSILRGIAGLLPGPRTLLSRRNPDDSWQILQAPHISIPTRRRQLAYAPQQPSLFPHLNVKQNINFSSGKSRTGEPLVNQALAAMDLFRLNQFAARLPRNLSGGERQRVNLARAFAVPRPSLMLLDEPFTGIGRALRDELLPAMRAWASDRNIPVLSVTHDVEEALQLDAEVVRIEDGRILAQGPAAQVLAPERARALSILTASSPAPNAAS